MARFVAIWLVALLGLFASVIAFTVLVDPYGILGMKRVVGLTAQKSAGVDWESLTKSYLVDAARPRTIVVGSSKVDVGIDPETDAWPTGDRPVFNLGIGGSGPDWQFLLLQHSLVQNSPALVLIGVSFEDSLTFTNPAAPTAESHASAAPSSDELRLHLTRAGVTNTHYVMARLADFVFATFSFHAVADSVATVLHQSDPDRSQQTALGFNTARSFGRWTRNEGWFSLMMDKEREKAPQLIRWARLPRVQVEPVGDMIRLAQSHGARVIVFIMPSYVDLYEMIRQIGIMPKFLAWKSSLASVVERASAGGAAVPLWDFSGPTPYTTEPLPASHDTATQMRWVWEPIHFRAQLGTLMIRRMMGTGGPEDLGTLVTAAGLPAQNEATDARQRAWAASHPVDVARVAAVLDEAAHAVCSTDLAGCPGIGTRSTASR